MIPKKKEDYLFRAGEGRPFEMNSRSPIEKSDAERQRPKLIDLDDLNGSGAPKNFHREAGRCLPSFTKSGDSDDEQDEDYDVE